MSYTVIGALRTRTFRVLWMLEELGLPYTHRPLPPRAPEVREVNASGKVPVLLDGDAAFTDSVAILTYLADRHGALTFPAGTPERARQDAATLALLDELEGPLWMATKHSFVLPEELRVPAVMDSLRWEIARAGKHAARRLGDGPWAMGGTFTVPDVLAGHLGNWAEKAGFAMPDPGWQAYLGRLRARPAFRKVDAM